MATLFETHKITIQGNGIQYKVGTRQPIGGFVLIAEHVPCHIGRVGTGNSTLRLHILKKYLDTLTDPIKKGFRIKDEDTNAEYDLIETPVWAGGMKHHIECPLEEVR